MIHSALKQHFGFDAFLNGQEDVISRIAEGKDVCCVMPTGAGKSLCYQLPALMKPGYSLILSPLISLMKDQVDALRQKGISAACVNSAMPDSEKREVMDAMNRGELKLLYVAPERLRVQRFRDFLASRPPDMIVIDEAHCISQWGHDFRPDYARIGEVVESIGPNLQVCAFTATATPHVRTDIMNVLRRPDMELFVTGFTRPELKFQIHQSSGSGARSQRIGAFLKDKVPTIIYASTRKNVDELVSAHKILGYHAGMTDNERHEVQEKFMNEPCPVIVATNAFGMGIDRADIRRVIHYNVPGSLEAYYQEAGRAGRDGKPAECILLCNWGDKYIHEFLIDLNHPPEEVVLMAWDTIRDLVRVDKTDLLEYTMAELAEMIPGCKADAQVSAALNILEKHGLVERGYRKENRGLLKALQPESIIRQTFPGNTQRGQFCNAVYEAFGDDLKFGIDCTWSDLSEITKLTQEQVKRVVRSMRGTQFEWEPPFRGRSIHVVQPDMEKPEIDFSEMQLHRQMEEARLDDMFKYAGSSGCRQKFLAGYFGQDTQGWQCGCCDSCAGGTPKSAAQGQNSYQLISDLKKIRDRIASQRGTMPYMILSNKALEGLAKEMPTTKGAALRVSGIGPKNQWYLPDFLDCIREYKRQGGGETVPEPVPVAPERIPLESFLNEMDDDDLYCELELVRAEIADIKGIAPQKLLPDAALESLALLRPMTKREASAAKGISERHLANLDPFLEVIRDWRNELF